MNPGDTTIRRILGVPLVSPAQVTLATNPAVCAQAGLTLDSLGRALAPSQPDLPPYAAPLYVIQIGSSFAILDTNGPPSTHHYLVFYFGPLWEYKSMASF